MGCSGSIEQYAIKMNPSINSHTMKANSKLQTGQELSECDNKRLRDVMERHPCLRLLGEKEKEMISECFTKAKYCKNVYIYRQHDLMSHAFILSEGQLSFEVDCCLVKMLIKNSYFGFDALAFDSCNTESIRVLSDECTVFQIEKERLKYFLKQTSKAHAPHIKSIFDKIHFFNYLTTKERHYLIENTIIYKYQKHDVIFEAEQIAYSFYIIKQGTVAIQIEKKQDIILKSNDYFGESMFNSLLHSKNKKGVRAGKASANEEDVEVVAIGLATIQACFGKYIYSIIFFNQQKFALIRDNNILTFQNVDYNFLLQLFNVKQGDKYEVLARNKHPPKYLYIPIQSQINKKKQLQVFCSQFLLASNEEKVLKEDIILTEPGFYAFAPLSEIRQILNFSSHSSLTNLKLQKQPLHINMMITLKNVSKLSRKFDSSSQLMVLIVQDMKFGCEFLVKVYQKSCENELNGDLSVRNLTQYKYKEGSINSVYSLKNLELGEVNLNEESSILRIGSNGETHQRKSTRNSIGERQESIKRQKQILNELCNKFVVGYYKSQQDHFNYYMFVQYIKGLPLSSVLNKFGILPNPMIKYYLASIVCALQYLHSKSIVYRDLKPENIIIKTTGKLIFVDFSCAKIIPNGKTATICGTPHYMAPEIILRKSYTFNVDLWSLGVILFEFMIGYYPFGNSKNDPLEIFESILSDELNLTKIYRNKHEKNLLRMLLEKDGEKRVNSVADIRKHAYISDMEFRWKQFESEQLQPPYFPQENNHNYKFVNNHDIFHLDSLQEWQ